MKLTNDFFQKHNYIDLSLIKDDLKDIELIKSCNEIIGAKLIKSINDFEEKILLNHPKISSVKQELYNVGALYASMTGSGSTVYGIFENLPEKYNPENCVIWSGRAKF